jgi:hypothetical protein
VSVMTEPSSHRDLTGPAATLAIPPEFDHEVEPVGTVRFSLDTFALDRDGEDSGSAPTPQGGPS